MLTFFVPNRYGFQQKRIYKEIELKAIVKIDPNKEMMCESVLNQNGDYR
jgi:hypothetical protein